MTSTPLSGNALTDDALVLPDEALRQAINQLCELDQDFRVIEAQAGPLRVRRWGATFAALVRVITGQQLSSKAAQSIFKRLTELIDLTPENLAACSDADLRAAGLSRAKITYCKALAEALLEQRLCLETLAALSDEAIVEQLTQIKGIGVWTAQIYMLFCLERLDSFPAADLALQASYQRLKRLPHRPSSRELMVLCEPLRPWRGVAAHLLWHYYRYADRASEI